VVVGQGFMFSNVLSARIDLAQNSDQIHVSAFKKCKLEIDLLELRPW